MTVNRFGEFFARMRRERLRLSLREFCERNGLDPGNMSRLERGKVAPPRSKEALERYAAALELKEGTEEWMMLFDLAAASRGEIPAELLSDEEVVSQLPVLFRTLRGDRVGDDQLKELLRFLRRA